MRQRHDALLEAFTEAPPNWAIFAQTVAELGITDAERKPPSPEVARQTWYRVRRDVAAHAARTSKSAMVLARDKIAPAIRSVAPDVERSQRMKLDIKPARAIAERPAVEPQASQASVGSTAPAALPAQSPEEQLRCVFGAMDADTTPLPKIIR